jgi:hypothetical protein
LIRKGNGVSDIRPSRYRRAAGVPPHTRKQSHADHASCKTKKLHWSKPPSLTVQDNKENWCEHWPCQHRTFHPFLPITKYPRIPHNQIPPPCIRLLVHSLNQSVSRDSSFPMSVTPFLSGKYHAQQTSLRRECPSSSSMPWRRTALLNILQPHHSSVHGHLAAGTAGIPSAGPVGSPSVDLVGSPSVGAGRSGSNPGAGRRTAVDIGVEVSRIEVVGRASRSRLGCCHCPGPG